MSGVVLHIGLPKTGTTTLQKSVFPHLASVQYAGKNIPGYGFATPELGNAICAVISIDSALADPVPALRNAVDALRTRCGDATLVISTESLAHPAARDLGLVAQRLASAVPDARILITLRAQEELALSWYRSHGRFAQYLFTHKRESERIHASLSQASWWEFVTREPHAGLLAMLDFNAIVSCYERLFASRVSVLPLEWLRSDPTLYAASLARAIDADSTACADLLRGAHENRGLSRREVWAGKALSLVGARADFLEHRTKSALRRWLARGTTADGALIKDIAASIRTRCATGNAQLARRMGIDFAALGYAVHEDATLGT